MSFDVTTRVRPLGGWSDTFADWAKEGPRWSPESGSMKVSQEMMDGQSVVKVVCKDKITFGGLWLKVPDLDLSSDPYLTVDVKPQDDLAFNMYLYDGKQQRNAGANQAKRIKAGEWQTVTFDFSGKGQMSTNKGKPIDAGWITGVLFNFHPKLSWPFTRYSGTILFRNLRIGSDADVPKRQPEATIAEVPDQVYLTGAGHQQVKLTGIGSGSAEAVAVKAAVSGDPVVGGLSVGGVGQDGTATLDYEVGSKTGKATVTVDVTAPGSVDKKVSFDVEVLDAARPVPVSIDCADRHQIIRGFGTYMNDLSPELYAKELGASAMRIGLIENQIEPVNDNSDPNVLYEGALNRKVFDFAHFRALHDAGVESFILTSWSPPAWMKTNLSMNYQQANAEGNTDTATNRLDYYQYQEFAESMVAAAKVFKEETGFDLLGIGLQNEPVFDEPYPSAILDPRHFVELIKVVGPRLKAAGIPVKLYMPEQVFSQTRSMNNYIAALDDDPVAEKYLRRGGHAWLRHDRHARHVAGLPEVGGHVEALAAGRRGQGAVDDGDRLRLPGLGLGARDGRHHLRGSGARQHRPVDDVGHRGPARQPRPAEPDVLRLQPVLPRHPARRAPGDLLDGGPRRAGHQLRQ